ncbi:DNA-3-methyladenine glycosylase [Streptomyces alkaliterrae]|uniref:Putative 3-methyladenine DNA glycosylase n=1 Tax=Streptomyces alkaliterrae TaxID=2213162 RepID=A0A5P0YJG2_9ACTN|nr:DNA-3-methyladenine glycosylase [Streptomyces alkaliterrae]MBB1252092.1 DNA-3-methyladenine glycosylase [Streptomyces alkaliterrae]MBB1260795.1 DNA-3-methyladenine glycosylase [Streptomyces alkaliterrae]MQS00456.1 DNA-3-methyladenine glycosylase [Streptomyces alkaliterrae]
MISGRDRTALPRTFFDRPVLDVAPDLLGRILVRTTPRGRMALRLTEVEAYDGERDPGSHAYRGRTARNAAMFGPPGHAYVYFTYGMWHCLNLVCGPEGKASGVLLRAGEVVSGVDLARSHRPNARRDAELAKGPARLATALDVDRALNGVDVCLVETDAELPAAPEPDGELGVLTGRPPGRGRVRSGPRTGVGGEGAPYPWRFWIEDDPTVSPYRAHQPRSRARLRTEAT